MLRWIHVLIPVALVSLLSCQPTAALKTEEVASETKVVHNFVDKSSIVAVAQDKVGRKGDVKVCAYEVSKSDSDDAVSKKVTEKFFSMDTAFQDSIGAKFVTASVAVTGTFMLSICAVGSLFTAELAAPVCVIGFGMVAGGIAGGVAHSNKINSRKDAWQKLINTISYFETQKEYTDFRKLVADSSNTDLKCPDIKVSKLRTAIKAEHKDF